MIAKLDSTKYARVRRFYAQEVFRCDEDIARLRVLRLVWIVNLLVLATILLSSCGTIEGMRRDIHNLTAPTRVQEGK
jgi:predicted small secreted protein